MDGRDYEILSGIAATYDYEVTPKPAEGEEVRFFDVTSELGTIQPASLLNSIHQGIKFKAEGLNPQIVTAQPHCVTFEDFNVR